MDAITDEEKKIVEELRRRTIGEVSPKMLEDPSLFYQFSKARDFKLAEAEIMLRNHIAWRKEMGMDTILTNYEPPEVLLKYLPLSFVCYDKAGCIVMIQDCGREDIKGILSAAKMPEIQKYIVYCFEKAKDRLIKQDGIGYKNFRLGKHFFSPLFDFEGLTYATAVNMKALQFLSAMVKTFMDNYPELLRTVTIFNAPFYFSWIFAVLKPLMPSTVLQKIRIYGSNGWKEALLENIDADDLPAYLGGNRTDPDGNPLCETFILRGQPVPKSNYIQKGKTTFSMEPNVESLTVMPLSKEEITFEVNEESSILEWEFETKSRDITFSLHFRGKTPEDSERVKLIPKQRIDSSDELEKGCFKCDKVGQYTIVFENASSWFHSKEVHYRAEVKSPKNNELYK